MTFYTTQACFCLRLRSKTYPVGHTLVQEQSNNILGIRMRIFASHQCADYACASYAGAGEVCVVRVTFAVYVGLGEVEAVWCL